jgi:hypothetical protein
MGLKTWCSIYHGLAMAVFMYRRRGVIVLSAAGEAVSVAIPLLDAIAIELLLPKFRE